MYYNYMIGGYLVFAESVYDNYTAKPFSEFPHIDDFILHPLRLKTEFMVWFLSHFDIIYEKKIKSSHTYDPISMINLHGIELGNILINHFKDKLDTCLYFIGRKPINDKGWVMLQNINNIIQD